MGFSIHQTTHEPKRRGEDGGGGRNRRETEGRRESRKVKGERTEGMKVEKRKGRVGEGQERGRGRERKERERKEPLIH